MKKFTDNQDRSWEIEINVAQVKRVKDILLFDLLEASDGSTLARLADDPCLLCDVLFILCRDQCAAEEVTDEDFGRGLAGDAIDRATDAFLEELIDFFPQRRRGPLKRVLAKVRRLEEAWAARTETILTGDKIDRLMEAEMDEAEAGLDEKLAALSNGSGPPPESSE